MVFNVFSGRESDIYARMTAAIVIPVVMMKDSRT